MSAIDEAAIARLRDALEDLMRCRPDDGPELLPGIAGGVFGLDPMQMDLLADAVVQFAGIAHRLAQERVEEMEDEDRDSLPD